MLSPKRAKLASKDDGTNEGGYLKSLQVIEGLQDEMEVMQSKHDREIAKLELKLETEKKPVYLKREEAICQIPNFWVTALMNHPDLAGLIHESEEEYLLHLSRIEVEFTGDSTTSFKLVFHFNENPYFKNTTLIKDYIMLDTSDEKPPFRSIKATPVMWKEGQDISDALRKRRSFLLWLTTLEFGSTDYDIAQIIKEDLWTNPLPYFLLSDNENEENSEEDDEDDDDDVLIIEDSDEEKSAQEEPEEESENDTEELDSPASSEVTQNEN